MENKEITVVEWVGHFTPTPEQVERKKRTGSYYRKEEKGGCYNVSKGRWV